MSSSFTNQTLAQIELWGNQVSIRSRSTRCPSISTKVARLHLAKIGVKLTTLSEKQSTYIGVSKTARSPIITGIEQRSLHRGWRAIASACHGYTAALSVCSASRLYARYRHTRGAHGASIPATNLGLGRRDLLRYRSLLVIEEFAQ
jgi:hypothetical protein